MKFQEKLEFRMDSRSHGPMEDETPISLFRGAAGRASRNFASVPGKVFFDRTELDEILNVYGVMVAAGEWRDYAIGDDGESAIFSVYRDSHQMPLYRIIKRRKPTRQTGAYSVVSASGEILRRCASLASALTIFRQPRLRLV